MDVWIYRGRLLEDDMVGLGLLQKKLNSLRIEKEIKPGVSCHYWIGELNEEQAYAIVDSINTSPDFCAKVYEGI